ncbi:MAG TPA: adenosylhomocysteinase [Nitrososphaerales archaeon]
MKSKIADPSLAKNGARQHEWAYNHMPILAKTIEKVSKKSNFNGAQIAVCLHVTKETSVLVIGLKKLGADIYLAAANPLSTQDDIAAYLDFEGVHVFAWRGENAQEYQDCIRQILRGKPEVVMDDGCDAHATIHDEKEFKSLNPRGGTEETTTGVIRLKALEKSGKLRYPVIAVNNAQTKHLFDNRYGTGQSTFDGILRATSLLMAGKNVVVCGYGWVGRGIATRSRGLGALTTVVEVDPVRALEARMDGFDVMPMSEAAKIGDFFITATGQTHVIRTEHIKSMKEGAILVNAGHFDVEIDVKGLNGMAKSVREVRPNVDEYALLNGKKVYLIGKGRIANLVAAEGHPPEVMSMSFSNQLLSAVRIYEKGKSMEKKTIDVPKDIDDQVARNALEAMGIKIDEPTKEQLKYGESWQL